MVSRPPDAQARRTFLCLARPRCHGPRHRAEWRGAWPGGHVRWTPEGQHSRYALATAPVMTGYRQRGLSIQESPCLQRSKPSAAKPSIVSMAAAGTAASRCGSQRLLSCPSLRNGPRIVCDAPPNTYWPNATVGAISRPTWSPLALIATTPGTSARFRQTPQPIDLRFVGDSGMANGIRRGYSTWGLVRPLIRVTRGDAARHRSSASIPQTALAPNGGCR